MPTRRARARRIERLAIRGVLLVAQPDLARISKRQRVASVARGHDAIEKVDAATDGFQQIDGPSDSH